MSSNLVPVTTAVLLFGALLYVGSTAKRIEDRLRETADTATTRLKREVTRSEALLAAGDTLPSVQLRDREGHEVDLSRLPIRYRYLYFGRPECLPCGVLGGLWSTVEPARRDSIAFIAFDPTRTVPLDSGEFTFSWVQDSSSRDHYVNRIPALVVRDGTGRIVSATHGSVLRVAATLDLYHLIPRTLVDSVVLGPKVPRAGSGDARASTRRS